MPAAEYEARKQVLAKSIQVLRISNCHDRRLCVLSYASESHCIAVTEAAEPHRLRAADLCRRRCRCISAKGDHDAIMVQ